jgi:hypothetical protein
MRANSTPSALEVKATLVEERSSFDATTLKQTRQNSYLRASALSYHERAGRSWRPSKALHEVGGTQRCRVERQVSSRISASMAISQGVR